MSELENKLNNIAAANTNYADIAVMEENIQPPVMEKTNTTSAVPAAENTYTGGNLTSPQMNNVEVKENVVSQQPLLEIVYPEEPKIAYKPIEQENEEFISDTFTNLQKNAELVENTKKPNDILGNIKVDLATIEIVDELSPMEEMNLEELILSDKTTKLVTCCQSSYWAEISALKSQEIQALDNSDVDYYNYKKKLFKLINKHMENTSVGRIDYGKWLHCTSFFDIDTLLYGLYCQTFNYENKYTITCPKCESPFDAIVNNNTLIETRGSEEELFAKINEIIETVHNQEDLMNKSHVHKTKRIILDESKIVVDIRIPSAYDYLEEVVAKSSNEELEDYQNAIGISLFVSDIMLPNVLLYNQTGKLNYVKLNIANKGKLLTTISNLSYYDSLQLSDEINDFVEKYRITYSIRNLTCPKCGHKINNVPLDLEQVLFQTIRRGRIGR